MKSFTKSLRKIVNKNIHFLVLILGLWSCENYQIEEHNHNLYFPIGRSFINSGEVKVILDDAEILPEFVYDSCGSYWIKIPDVELPQHGVLKFKFKRVKSDLHLFPGEIKKPEKWLEPSFYIDSDNEAIKLKALELTDGIESSTDKAKSIHQFVSQHIRLNIYKDSFLDKASKTYELRYGTCMNFSRLYVALCRAAGIPARSIWGVIYGDGTEHRYNNHHQWAEIQDEDGFWHPADFNYSVSFDLNDIRYLDLIYAAEENSLIANRSIDLIIMEGITYFNNYPTTLTGNLGFRLINDSRPDSMSVEYSYEF